MTTPSHTALATRIVAMRAKPGSDVLTALLADSDDPQSVVDELGAALHLGVVRVSDLAARSPRFDLLSFAECNKRRCALVSSALGSTDLRLVITDPFDTDQIAWARTRFGAVDTDLASPDTFDAWLTQCEAGMTALSSMTVGEQGAESLSMLAIDEDLNLRQIGAHDSPAIQFVNSTLYDALKTGASDIHLESDPAARPARSPSRAARRA